MFLKWTNLHLEAGSWKKGSGFPDFPNKHNKSLSFLWRSRVKKNTIEEKMKAYWSRRKFIKTIASVPLFSSGIGMATLALAEDVPAEPSDLDEPTAWQEGDPEPEEASVPATEPDQTSTDAPPSQPMDDDRGEQPDADHAWVYGYWWWTSGHYVWVPGYWAVPPQPEYVYIPGYWGYQDVTWVYVRGGWGVTNTTTVVVYAHPRPVLTLFVFTAPIRIVRRHRRWRHHRTRHRHHRPHRSPRANLRPRTRPAKSPAKAAAKTPAKASAKSPAESPAKTPTKTPARTPARTPAKSSARQTARTPARRR